MLRSGNAVRLISAHTVRAFSMRASSIRFPSLASGTVSRTHPTALASWRWSRPFASDSGSAVRVIDDMKDYEEACKANEGKLIVAYHTAAWCGPCKRIAPHVEELAKGHSKDVAVLKIDVDECQDVAAANGIEAMPTFLILKDGKPVEKIVGAALDALLTSVAKNK